MACRATPITSPRPSEDGDGGYRSMAAALKRAGLTPADIDYINAHGTSTMADTIELGAVERLMGDAAAKATMRSTKSSHRASSGGGGRGGGDLLRAGDPRPGGAADDQPGQPGGGSRSWTSRRTRRGSARSTWRCRTRFGFGGTNASLVLGKVRGLMWRSRRLERADAVHRGADRWWRGCWPGGGSEFTGPGPLAEAICLQVERGASLAAVSRQAGGAGRDQRRADLPDRGGLCRPGGRAEVRELPGAAGRLDGARCWRSSRRAGNRPAGAR